MGKVTQVSDNDLGSFCRQSWNEAMKTVETNASISGDGTVGDPLGTTVDNTCDLSSNSTEIPPSVVGVKCYISDAVNAVFNSINWKSYSFKSRSGTSGIQYAGGYYDYPDSSIGLNQGANVGMWGVADNPYSAHFFVVIGLVNTTDGGALVLTVTGDSIADDGTVTLGDSEIVVADATLASPNDYFQTTKRWIGEVTFTLTSAGATAFALEFNYGYALYEAVDVSFVIDAFEAIGEAASNDSDFKVELIHHTDQNWTYAGAGFMANNNPANVISSTLNMSPKDNINNNVYFGWKNIGINYLLGGTPLPDGVLIRITTGTNNSIANMDMHIRGFPSIP